jgi:heme-degrading monooxygenase HmoA
MTSKWRSPTSDPSDGGVRSRVGEAQTIIAGMPGYLTHQLQRCPSATSYLMRVHWATLEAHTRGFRGSREYQRWKALLHHFYDPFPTVEHYRRIL